MTKHYPELRQYVMNVTKSMIARGVIRRGRGESTEDVIRAEGGAILDALKEDFAQLVVEFGVALAVPAMGTLRDGIHGGIDRALERGASMIVDAVMGNRR